jgi:hypothetical protein
MFLEHGIPLENEHHREVDVADFLLDERCTNYSLLQSRIIDLECNFPALEESVKEVFR